MLQAGQDKVKCSNGDKAQSWGLAINLWPVAGPGDFLCVKGLLWRNLLLFGLTFIILKTESEQKSTNLYSEVYTSVQTPHCLKSYY